MKEVINKLIQIEKKISSEKGQFLLFALFLREDAPDLWDLMVAASWVEKDKSESLKHISDHLKKTLDTKELIKLSRIVLIDTDNPALDALHKAIHIEHGDAEIKDSNFFGLQIKHAYVITAKPEKAPDKGIE